MEATPLRHFKEVATLIATALKHLFELWALKAQSRDAAVQLDHEEALREIGELWKLSLVTSGWNLKPPVEL